MFLPVTVINGSRKKYGNHRRNRRMFSVVHITSTNRRRSSRLIRVRLGASVYAHNSLWSCECNPQHPSLRSHTDLLRSKCVSRLIIGNTPYISVINVTPLFITDNEDLQTEFSIVGWVLVKLFYNLTSKENIRLEFACCRVHPHCERNVADQSVAWRNGFYS